MMLRCSNWCLTLTLFSLSTLPHSACFPGAPSLCWQIRGVNESILPHISGQMSDLYKHTSILTSNICLLQTVAIYGVMLMAAFETVWSAREDSNLRVWDFGCPSWRAGTTYVEPQFLFFITTSERGDWIWDCIDWTPREDSLLCVLLNLYVQISN